MPDFLDRLLVRHTPAVRAAAGAVTGPDDGPVRVRPRLPGPFERIEALGAGTPPEGDAAAAHSPVVPRPVERPEAPVRTERATHTEHRTVVRTELAPREEPVRRTTEPPPAAPLLRPAAPVSPAPRPARPEAGRRARREPVPADGAGAPPRTAAASLLPAGPAAAPATPAAVPLRPRADEASAAREAARATAGRRRSREAERVVHVQIGRLEVNAGGSSARRGAAERPGRQGRPTPEMSLQDYLTRGERRG